VLTGQSLGKRTEPFSFTESSFGFKKLEDVMHQRVTPDGRLKGPEPAVPNERLLWLYEWMLFGRTFDDKAAKMSTLREIGNFGTSKGQEATQLGFISALEKGDWFVPMSRDIAAILAFGLPPLMILQYFGGDEGGMKIPEGLNMFPIVAPVSGQIPHASGLGIALKLQKKRSVALVSTGDGGTSKGDFHEALNFAGVYRLPVVFAVENNQWAISVRRENQTASKTLAQKAVAYGFEGILVDGNDVIACHEVTKYATEKARNGGGPTLIEFYTYRMGPYSTTELVSNKLKAQEEILEWEKKDPILRMETYLGSRGVLDGQTKDAIKLRIKTKIDEAITEYRQMKPPSPLEIFRNVYDRPSPRLVEQMKELSLDMGERNDDTLIAEPVLTVGKAELNMRNALNMALTQEMKRDGRVVVFEDVGKNGGVFQVTRGLQDQFGEGRVFDTPLAEPAIAGIFVGPSVGGLTPVAEFQFDGFAYSAFYQVVSHVARLGKRTRGRYHSRDVIRFPYGAGIRAPEHHSDSPEAYFSHTPGLKVVIPSNAFDAKGLLASAVREPNPVVFMEPKKLYDSPKMPVPEEEYMVPLGKAKVVREGAELTIVSYGAMMVPTLNAADSLAKNYSASAEVIDLRTISPFDLATVLGSVKKTGRMVVVHEAQRNCGVGAEIVSEVAEKAIDYIRAPPKRVTGFDTVVPLARLEDVYLPNTERVLRACLDILNY
jgi:pyruvate/2-oxoglutarate/acetoin dehydrogenase E1 component/TPP-dependent pyruvate/acetoin dehydrogenase alpha subunit